MARHAGGCRQLIQTLDGLRGQLNRNSACLSLGLHKVSGEGFNINSSASDRQMLCRIVKPLPPVSVVYKGEIQHMLSRESGPHKETILLHGLTPHVEEGLAERAEAHDRDVADEAADIIERHVMESSDDIS